MRRASWFIVAVVALGGACRTVPPPPPPPPAPPPAPPVVYAAPDTVWTATPAVALRGETDAVSLPRPLTRLEVVGADSASLLVRCSLCPDSLAERWVSRSDVLHLPTTPDSAATRSLAEFALALRHAAARRDLGALWPVMAADFSFSAIGAYGRDLALSSWRSENFVTLDEAPRLLDGGLAPLGEWWVAPVEYASGLGYRGLRLGIHRAPTGRWEWVFLVRGEGG